MRFHTRWLSAALLLLGNNRAAWSASIPVPVPHRKDGSALRDPDFVPVDRTPATVVEDHAQGGGGATVVEDSQVQPTSDVVYVAIPVVGKLAYPEAIGLANLVPQCVLCFLCFFSNPAFNVGAFSPTFEPLV
jgi:hypothetical protein